MATNTFVKQDDFDLAKKQLKSSKEPIVGLAVDSKKAPKFPAYSQDFSDWLGDYLLKRLSKFKNWENAEPIALGSWAREELSPKSDVDLLFCGDEKFVKPLVDELQEHGIKLRYRVPEDPNDWTKGVEPFDVLAVLHGKAFFKATESKLHRQQEQIKKRGVPFAKNLLKAMLAERKARTQRHDSISSYLQPNIKYGPGGLRDLQQALYVYDLFKDKFTEAGDVLRVLDYYKKFFTFVRQHLHLKNLGDVLVAPEQPDLGLALGYEDPKKFMREVQLGLSRVSFYADWIVEIAKSSRVRISKTKEKKISTPGDAFKVLSDDPTLLMQGRVRAQGEEIFSKLPKKDRRSLGKVLLKYIDAGQPDRYFVALFRSKLMEFSFPEMSKIIGLVQHDQYHRYSVDAHLLQTVREIVRIKRQPGVLGKLSPIVKSFDNHDWKVMLWAGLYHDLAKGRKGDHSSEGTKLVKKDFTEMGFSLRLTIEVAWMVANHLLLSTAAFRRDPRAKSTWRFLHGKDVKGKKLERLAVFTAVDIRATNPDAWSGWKESLLADLVGVVKSEKATKFMKLLSDAESAKLKISKEFIRGLEPFLVEQVPTKFLLEDYKLLTKEKTDLPIRFWKNKEGEMWIRFHRKKDRPGLFLEFTQLLFAAGCRVRESSIQTYAKYGAYDWFKVKSSKPVAQLKKMFTTLENAEHKLPKVQFDNIKLISRVDEEQECIISFRGKDQNGALVSAVKALFDEGLTIKWAKVHTWGRQIDDIFCVELPSDIGDTMSCLVNKHQRPELRGKVPT